MKKKMKIIINSKQNLFFKVKIKINKFFRFKKGELLGEGSFGIVYQYWNGENGKIYAVKEINIERLSKRVKDVSQKLTTEIEILSNLNHKNMVKYYGVFLEDNNLNIIFEYCIEGSLSCLLNIFKILIRT